MLLTIILALIVLSILILVHELGHFLIAKRTGMGVEEFGFGYPPRIFAKKIGETVYSVNWLLFGGFVKLLGEDLEESEKLEKKEKSFWYKSKKARTAVIIAGVIGNFLLAVICFSVVYSVAGIPTQTNQVEIVGLAEDGPAFQVGLKEGDLVLGVNEILVDNVNQFVDLVNQEKGQEISLDVKRNDEELTFSLVPRENPPEGEGALGVVISDMKMKKYSLWQMPFYGTKEGLKEAFAWTGLIAGGIGQMLGNLLTKGQVPKEIAGPVGILQLTSVVAQSGWLTVIQFVGVLSINLAILNILPFPALDGGKLIFIAYEAIARKKPKPKIEQWVNLIGMALLMFLLVLVTINDVCRLIETTSLGNKLRSVLPF